MFTPRRLFMNEIKASRYCPRGCELFFHPKLFQIPNKLAILLANV